MSRLLRKKRDKITKKTVLDVPCLTAVFPLYIQNQWQVFATLWGTTPGTLRSAYNKANDQRKTLKFIEKLKNALS